jgi:hypothetical protein
VGEFKKSFKEAAKGVDSLPGAEKKNLDKEADDGGEHK